MSSCNKEIALFKLRIRLLIVARLGAISIIRVRTVFQYKLYTRDTQASSILEAHTDKTKHGNTYLQNLFKTDKVAGDGNAHTNFTANIACWPLISMIASGFNNWRGSDIY